MNSGNSTKRDDLGIERHQDDVEVLIYLNWPKTGEKDDEILCVSKNLSATAFATEIIKNFGEKITSKGFKFIYIQKFHKKFDRFVTLKLNESNFVDDGAIFEVFPSNSNKEHGRIHFEVKSKKSNDEFDLFSNINYNDFSAKSTSLPGCRVADSVKHIETLTFPSLIPNVGAAVSVDFPTPSVCHPPSTDNTNISSMEQVKFTTKHGRKTSPHFTSLPSLPKLSSCYPYQTNLQPNQTSNRKSTKRKLTQKVFPIWRCPRRTAETLLPSSQSPPPRKRRDSDSSRRKRRHSNSPHRRHSFDSPRKPKHSSLTRKHKNPKSKRCDSSSPHKRYSKSPKHESRLKIQTSQSDESHHSHSPPLPLNQLDKKWNGRFTDCDVSLSGDEAGCDENNKRHRSRRTNDLSTSKRRLQRKSSEASLKKKEPLFQIHPKIRRPSLLPAPATLEEHIDKLLGRCRVERNPSKQATLIIEILGMYKILGNTSESIKREFDQKIETSDRRFSGYDFAFSENFEDFWSYGILEYSRTEAIDNTEIIKNIIGLNVDGNVWETDIEDRCSKAFQLIGAFCIPSSALMLQRIVYDVSTKEELDNCISKTEWHSPRIICFTGKYHLSICGQAISLFGGLPDAMALYIILHFYFCLRFPDECREILYVVTVLMGLPLPARISLSLKQLDLIRGAFDIIQKNKSRFDERKLKNLKWTPILMHNSAPVLSAAVAPLNKTYLNETRILVEKNNYNNNNNKITDVAPTAVTTNASGIGGVITPPLNEFGSANIVANQLTYIKSE